MKFEAIEIKRNIKYNFIIGTVPKADNSLKERTRGQIREAMEGLGREPDSYSVSIVHDPEPEERGDSEYPELQGRSDYLIFAILGDSAESLSDKELEEQKEELSRGIFSPHNSRIALVLLRDSSISLITTQMSSEGRIFFV